MNARRKKLLFGVLAGIGSAALCIGLWLPGWLDGFEAKTWDQRVRHLARPGPDTSRIVLIKLDQASLDWGREKHGLPWPWPRAMYDYLLAFCRRNGAQSVAFDVLFTEASAFDASDDEALGNSVAATTGFVGAVFFGAGSGASTQWPGNVALQPWQLITDEATSNISWLQRCAMPLAAFPIPEVATNAALLANVHANPDDDGVYRRVAPFVMFNQKLVPALGMAPFLNGSEQPGIRLNADHVVIRNRRILLDQNGAAILRFRGPIGVYRSYSAADVIQSEVDFQAGAAPVLAGTNIFHGCHVFFGFTAPGLYDLRTAPVGRKGVYPGMGIQATLMDNILTGDFMSEMPMSLSLALILALGLASGVATIFCRNGWETVFAFLILLPVAPLLSVLAYMLGFWMTLVATELSAMFAMVGAVLINYATEGRQKRFIRNAFRQYLSAEVIEQLVADPGRLKLGGEQRTLSIFFSDLQGFTGISETLTPEQLTSLLNDYLTAMTDIIQAEGGTVDKYEGDAIIAFWNAPVPQHDHARRAVNAALKCQAALADLRPVFHKRTGRDLFMRIGINTGAVVVGNMGSRNRFNYTILGDAANLASRLEGVNKQFDSHTLVSEAAMRAMQEALPCREISRVAVVGRKTPVRVFEPMFPETFEEQRELFDAFAAALECFYKGDFPAAKQAFDAIAPHDPVAAAYVRKCRELIAEPPAKWEGVWIMKEK